MKEAQVETRSFGIVPILTDVPERSTLPSNMKSALHFVNVKYEDGSSVANTDNTEDIQASPKHYPYWLHDSHGPRNGSSDSASTCMPGDSPYQKQRSVTPVHGMASINSSLADLHGPSIIYATNDPRTERYPGAHYGQTTNPCLPYTSPPIKVHPTLPIHESNR